MIVKIVNVALYPYEYNAQDVPVKMIIRTSDAKIRLADFFRSPKPRLHISIPRTNQKPYCAIEYKAKLNTSLPDIRYKPKNPTIRGISILLFLIFGIKRNKKNSVYRYQY